MPVLCLFSGFYSFSGFLGMLKLALAAIVLWDRGERWGFPWPSGEKWSRPLGAALVCTVSQEEACGWQAGGAPGHGLPALLQSPPRPRKDQANSSTLQKKWFGQGHRRGPRDEGEGGSMWCPPLVSKLSFPATSLTHSYVFIRCSGMVRPFKQCSSNRVYKVRMS